MNRLVPGFVLSGRYRLAGALASGGMGQVWSAVDEVLDRRVAIKVMHPQTAAEQALVRRFHAEATIATQLTHPGIVDVFGHGEHDGLAYLVMELVEGPTLAHVVGERGALPPAQVGHVVSQLASALEHAHAAGVIHRDLKPSNVLLAPGGEVKLMDFGIAKSLDGPSHTGIGEVLGTTYYISPEQALGEPVTPATDLYSLGVLGHELLTGAKPFDRGTPIATALAQVEEPPPRLPATVPAGLADLVLRCLAKDPAQRPDAPGVVAALASLEQMPVPVAPATAPERLARVAAGDFGPAGYHPARPLAGEFADRVLSDDVQGTPPGADPRKGGAETAPRR